MKDINQHIATILKTLRKQQGWSLDKTAIETEVSKAMLGQIERGESSPTIATLWKIANGFNTSFSTFIEETKINVSKAFYLSNELPQLRPQDKKIRVKTLFPFDTDLKMEVFMIELLPGCEHLSAPHKNKVIEHVIVVEGKIDIFIDNNWQTLKKGEGLRFNAAETHGYYNKTSKKACFHNIIHYIES